MNSMNRKFTVRRLPLKGNELNNQSNIVPGLTVAYIMSSEESEEDRIFDDIVNRIRTHFTNAVTSGTGDRVVFETIINELVQYRKKRENTFVQTVDKLKQDCVYQQRMKDYKITEWKDRYEKLHARWDELQNHLSLLQQEKEDIRQQRDLLMCSEKKKELFEQVKNFSPENIQRAVFKKIITAFLNGITEELSADRGAIFLYYSPTDELKSICLKPELVHQPGKPGKSEIRIPSTTGIAGNVFTTGEALNILNAYSDNRFYRGVDKQTGYVTRVVLCYPIYSPKTGNIIGVLQLINKKSEAAVFTVEDEARCAEYALLIGYLIDAVPFIHSEVEVTKREPSGNAPLARKGSTVYVKRIGHKKKDPLSSVLEKPSTLIPKDIEAYIKKLEMCWRKGVGESADLKNKVQKLEDEKAQLQTKIFSIEKKYNEIEQINKELKEKIQNYQNELKKQRLDFIEKERELQDQIRSAKQMKLNEIYEQSSTQTPKRNRLFSNDNLPYLDVQKTKKFYHMNTKIAHTDRSPHSTRSLKERHKFKMDIYSETFYNSPTPMCLLTRNHRIWRVNNKFLELVEATDQELLGTSFSELCVGIDRESLPRLLQFDVIQGLGLKKPQYYSQNESDMRKSFVKVNIHVSRLGKFSTSLKKPPIYILVLLKSESGSPISFLK